MNLSKVILSLLLVLNWTHARAQFLRKTFQAGETLEVGKAVDFPYAGGLVSLVLERNGNLVLHQGFTEKNSVVWSSGTSEKGAKKLTLQKDCNLVLFDAGRIVWSTDTAGMGEDCELGVIPFDDKINTELFLRAGLSKNSKVKPDRTMIWSSKGTHLKRLWPGDSLLVGEKLYVDGKQDGFPAGYLTLEKDGELVLYDKNLEKSWSTKTGRKSGRLVMQDDCELVLFDKIDSKMWSSGTSGKAKNCVLTVQTDSAGQPHLYINEWGTEYPHSRVWSSMEDTNKCSSVRPVGLSTNIENLDKAIYCKNKDGRWEIFWNAQRDKTTDSIFNAFAMINNPDFVSKTTVMHLADYDKTNGFVVESNKDGRLEVFYFQASNSLKHRWQVGNINYKEKKVKFGWHAEHQFSNADLLNLTTTMKNLETTGISSGILDGDIFLFIDQTLNTSSETKMCIVLQSIDGEWTQKLRYVKNNCKELYKEKIFSKIKISEQLR